MSDDEPWLERLRAAEEAIASLRLEPPTVAARVRLAHALLEKAHALEEIEFDNDRWRPPASSERLEEALACASEVAYQLGASTEPELDAVTLDALMFRSRLLVLIARPDEVDATAAAIRSRIGDEQQQAERAEALYDEARAAYDRVTEDPTAVMTAGEAIEQLCAPYAAPSPPPPDSVTPWVAAALNLIASIVEYQGDTTTASMLVEQVVERFGAHPDADVQRHVTFARQLVEELRGGSAAPRVGDRSGDRTPE